VDRLHHAVPLVGIVVNIALIVTLSKDEVKYWCQPD
jgi:hypothetical protein